MEFQSGFFERMSTRENLFDPCFWLHDGHSQDPWRIFGLERIVTPDNQTYSPESEKSSAWSTQGEAGLSWACPDADDGLRQLDEIFEIVGQRVLNNRNIQKVKTFDGRTRFTAAHDRGKFFLNFSLLDFPERISGTGMIFIEMFKVLNRLWKQYKVALSEFEGAQYPLSDQLMEILDRITEEVSWRQNRRFQLLKRIRRVMAKKTFSTREVKLVSKLVNMQLRETGKIDYEAVLYYFPGKTAAQIEQVFEGK